MNAGRDTGEMAIAHESSIRHVDRGSDRIFERLKATVIPPGFCKLEQAPFRVLDLLLWGVVDWRIIGDVDHVFANANERAACRKIIDRAAIILGVDDGHSFGRQACHILEYGQITDLALIGQEGLHRNRIGHLADTDKVGGNFVDTTMQRLEEMGWLQKVRNPVKSVIVDQNSTEECLFRFNIVGCFTIKRIFLLARIIKFAYRRFRHDSLVLSLIFPARPEVKLNATQPQGDSCLER